MSGNTLLTSSIILDRAMAVLFQAPTFLDKVNRQYDDRFSRVYGGGGKPGDTVQVRIPQRATIRSGRNMSIEPQVDQVVNVTVSTQLGVDTGATSAEMSLDINDYQEQFIDTKIPDLVAAVEYQALSTCIPQVWNEVGDFGSFNDVSTVLAASTLLGNNLAPMERYMLTNLVGNAQVTNSLTGLFNPQTTIGDQFKTGLMSRNTLGYDWYQTSLMPSLARGSANGSYLTAVGIATDGGSTVDVDTGSGTFIVGDVITIAGVNAVHPQTKQNLGYLQEFVLTQASAGGTVTLHVSPSFYLTGPKQNISALPVDDVAVTIKGTASTTFGQNIAFSPDAFYFVTADLPNPKGMGVDCAQRTWKGITMRFMNGFDISQDLFVSRFDILFGAGVLRPELAVRIPNDLTAA